MKNLHYLSFAALAMAMDSPYYGLESRNNGPILRTKRKTILTKSQQKSRAKAKRAKKARKLNR